MFFEAPGRKAELRIISHNTMQVGYCLRSLEEWLSVAEAVSFRKNSLPPFSEMANSKTEPKDYLLPRVKEGCSTAIKVILILKQERVY